MGIYEERLTNDLEQIKDEVLALGSAVARAVSDAVKATLDGNRELANRTIIHDKPINRKNKEINGLCFKFIATHLPSAGHLRQIVSTLMLVSELERIGDYAETIARESLQLPNAPTGNLRAGFAEIAGQAQNSLENAISAYRDDDAEAARNTLRMASQVTGRTDHLFTDTIESQEKLRKEDISCLLDMLTIIARLKRISDRAKNICEETVFIVTGEVKKPRPMRVLFLDPGNNCQSQLAEAIARRDFPNTCICASAGRAAEAELAPDLHHFMESKGLAQAPIHPKAIDLDVELEGAHDVIVSLNGPVSDYLDHQPFRTVFLEWEVGDAPRDKTGSEEHYTTMYREIAGHIRDLMHTLRGEEAD